MASEWRELSLREAGVQLIDCDHRTPPAAEHGYPYIAIPQLKDGRVDLDGVRRISAQHFAEWTRKLLPKAHDVIVVRRCNSGVSAVIPDGLECAIGQNLVVLRSNGEHIHPPYLRWLVRGAEWWAEVNTYINVGAVFDSLKCKDIPNFRIPVPSIDQQKKIAGFLQAIDDRIDNLRQTNVTLEAIAQALFKSWFVDFDPVHAKAEGREPEGMDAATAALFPSEFEDSELGPIPKGWRIGASDEFLQIVGGGTPKTSVDEYWGGDIPWFSVVDAPASGQVFTLDTAKKITDLGLANCSAKLLPAMTTIISARGTVGKVAMTGVPMAMNQSCYALRPRVEGGEAFIYFSTLRFVEQLQQIAHGAVFDTVTRDSFKRIMTCLPPEKTITSFGLMTGPLLERIRTNGLQAASLAALRDTLLPRLISGRLRLTEAEPVIEDLFA